MGSSGDSFWRGATRDLLAALPTPVVVLQATPGGLRVAALNAPCAPFVEDGLDAADLVVTLGYDMVEYHPHLWNPRGDKRILHIDFEPAEPELDDTFDIDISIDLEIELDTDFDLDEGESIVLETDTFGSIFSDGFESGDVSAWTASSPDTFAFRISSSDPNVRFIIVPEPSSGLLALVAGIGLIARRRR